MEFDSIYNAYWQKIYRVCCGYLGDPDWAKDVTQDTFIAVWNNLGNFRNEASVTTWIYRIAVNNCLRQLERSKRLPKSEVPEQISENHEPQIEAKIAFLYACIGALKEIDRIVISLELEDIKQAEIASIVGISEANVRVRIHRIKEKLTEKFKRYDGD
ncbi:MAG TPA: RNA polymerase sigma factor [Flavobacterium sp.]|nr:RNA polymerase sigma factor [Flavobacterium sp.]